MSLEVVSQNVTQQPPLISLYFKTIIENKVAGIALTCFETIVHWLLTTCSCFYPAYNRFYEHQRGIETDSSRMIESVSLSQEVTPSIPLVIQTLASGVREPENPGATILAQQEPPVIELENLQPLNLNLLFSAEASDIIAESWKEHCLYTLTDRYTQLTPLLAKNCLEVIRTKLVTSDLMQVVATLELALSSPACTVLSDLIKDELVQRLNGQNPLEGDAESKQAAQKILLDLLVAEVDIYTAAISLLMWETLPCKFEPYSFRSTALLEILNTKMEQSTLKELETAVSTIVLHELQGTLRSTTVPPALETTPIHKMQAKLEQLLNNRSLDQEINELEAGTPPQSQSQEIVEFSWQPLNSIVNDFYFNRGPTAALSYQKTILEKLPYALILPLMELLEELVLTPNPFGEDPKVAKVEFLNNALKAELCFRSGKDLFKTDGSSARIQLYELLRSAIEKNYNSDLMLEWCNMPYKFQAHSFRSAAMLEVACDLEQNLEQLKQLVSTIVEADTTGALNPTNSFLPLEVASLNKIKTKIAMLSGEVDIP